MCNYKHPDSKPIPESGVGWKMFKFHSNPFIISGLNCGYDSTNGVVTWIENRCGNGFCFFLSERLAKKALKEWQEEFENHHYILLKIFYRNGIGKHKEGQFCDKPIQIALCQEFELANQYDRKNYVFSILPQS